MAYQYAPFSSFPSAGYANGYGPPPSMAPPPQSLMPALLPTPTHIPPPNTAIPPPMASPIFPHAPAFTHPGPASRFLIQIFTKENLDRYIHSFPLPDNPGDPMKRRCGFRVAPEKYYGQILSGIGSDEYPSAALERAAEDYIRIATSKNFLPAAVERIIGATNMDPATFSALVQSTVAHVRRVEEISGSCGITHTSALHFCSLFPPPLTTRQEEEVALLLRRLVDWKRSLDSNGHRDQERDVDKHVRDAERMERDKKRSHSREHDRSSKKDRRSSRERSPHRHRSRRDEGKSSSRHGHRSRSRSVSPKVDARKSTEEDQKKKAAAAAAGQTGKKRTWLEEQMAIGRITLEEMRKAEKELEGQRVEERAEMEAEIKKRVEEEVKKIKEDYKKRVDDLEKEYAVKENALVERVKQGMYELRDSIREEEARKLREEFEQQQKRPANVFSTLVQPGYGPSSSQTSSLMPQNPVVLQGTGDPVYRVPPPSLMTNPPPPVSQPSVNPSAGFDLPALLAGLKSNPFGPSGQQQQQNASFTPNQPPPNYAPTAPPPSGFSSNVQQGYAAPNLQQPPPAFTSNVQPPNFGNPPQGTFNPFGPNQSSLPPSNPPVDPYRLRDLSKHEERNLRPGDAVAVMDPDGKWISAKVYTISERGQVVFSHCGKLFTRPPNEVKIVV